ncbi:hypothetical protein BH23GEM10_BH23GEM10_13590 [soil metagenome]
MIGGCMKKVVVLVVLLALLSGAWLFRDRLRTMLPGAGAGANSGEQPTLALADAAGEKLDGLRTGEQSRTALSAIELESLLLFHYRGVLPAFMDSTQIEMVRDQLRLRARVPVDKLPRVDGLAEAAAFLPDTAELTVTGRLLPLEGGRVAFAVDQVSAARFPLPSRLVPGALSRLGRVDEPGLPPDAMALPLPSGVTSAYIRRDSLVLLSGAAGARGNDDGGIQN